MSTLSVELQQIAVSEGIAPATPLLVNTIASDPYRAAAFGISSETVPDAAERRLTLWRSSYPQLAEFCQSRFESSVWMETAWNLWLPLALWLHDRRLALGRPLIQGVLGGQGTGKTTLAAILTRILQTLGCRTVSLSLDDLYKTHAERQQLRQRDPRLRWRGPPGTHDVDLGQQVLAQFCQSAAGSSIAVPRFDKSLHQGSGDRVAPEWVEAADIVLFEGWFVGACPINPACFANAPAPITTEDDRAFARDMNAALHAYLPLWQQLDSLLVLYPVDYRLSQQWRKQAEQELRASGKPGMSDAEIEAFVDYFWKALHPQLFITPLTRQGADLVVEIQPDHSPGAVYCPTASAGL